jgi:hypothetical protein
MPFWTKLAPAGCLFPQEEASLGGVAEVEKRPNFIEFYKISRSLTRDWDWDWAERTDETYPIKGSRSVT